ncbi:hypothetical protein, partial [Pseudomonas sp. SDO5271_S396]
MLVKKAPGAMALLMEFFQPLPIPCVSSHGEAAKAVGQVASVSAVRPSSQASQLPHWNAVFGEKVPGAMVLLTVFFPTTASPLWELSSPGEAAKAVGQVASVSAVRP